MLIHLIRMLYVQLMYQTLDCITPIIQMVPPEANERAAIIEMVEDELQNAVTESFVRMRETLGNHFSDDALDGAAFFAPGDLYELVRQQIAFDDKYYSTEDGANFPALQDAIQQARGDAITEKAIRTAFNSDGSEDWRNGKLALELLQLVVDVEVDSKKYLRLSVSDGKDLPQLEQQ